MNTKKGLRMVLGFVMAVLFILLFNRNLLGIKFHEVAGVAVLLLFLLQGVFHWKWITYVTKNLFNKSVTAKTRVKYFVDGLLLIALAFTAISGVFISEAIFKNGLSNNVIFRNGHTISLAISLVLMGVHIGFSWGSVMEMFKEMFHITHTPMVAKAVLWLLTILLVSFGCFNISATKFINNFSSTPMQGNWQGMQRPPNDMQQGDQSNAPQSGNNRSGGNRPSVGGNTPNANGNSPSVGNNRSGGNGGQPNFGGNRQNANGGQNSFGADSQRPNNRNNPARSRNNVSYMLWIMVSTLSIMGVFVALSYYISKFIRRGGAI